MSMSMSLMVTWVLSCCRHQSKFVQYLMFHMCGLDPAFMDSFLGAVSAAVLCEEEGSAKTPMDMRLVCCAYMSSFLGRASFVPVSRLRAELTELVQWAHKYLAENKSQDDLAAAAAAAAAGTGAEPAAASARHAGSTQVVAMAEQPMHPHQQQHQLERPAARHRLFYSVLQCIFYVIGFRHKELFKQEDCVTWMRSLDLRRLVSSWLKPLIFCSPDICRLFVHIVKDAKVIDCTVSMDDATEAWSTHHRYNASRTAALSFLLQSFFPFDPYQLPISAQHVNSVGYLRFQDCIGEEVRVTCVCVHLPVHVCVIFTGQPKQRSHDCAFLTALCCCCVYLGLVRVCVCACVRYTVLVS